MSVDLALMKRLHLSETPRIQIFLAHTFLRANYAFPRKSEIVLEGFEKIPKGESVFFAMNHTDRYNYWPFQYALWRQGPRFTATWVKGKYFENRFVGGFMIATNNIPLPSRGYVIAVEFRRVAGRVPTGEEYRVLRDLADGVPGVDAGKSTPEVARFVESGELTRFEETFAAMIGEVARLTKSALDMGHDVLVFPQGTRSIRLSKGHGGLAQMSQHLGKTIVPVGCSGSDKLYPAGSPWSKGGRVVYRVGEPMRVDGPELKPFRVAEPFQPLTLAAGKAHGAAFAAITERVMARINELVDEPYRFAPHGASDGVKEMERFV